MFKRNAAFALSGVFALSGCLEARIVSSQKLSSSTPVTQNFVASDKVDLLVAVNGSSMTSDQQKEIQASIDAIMSLLAQSGYDYHVGLVSTAPAQANASSGGLGGLLDSLLGGNKPQSQADWINTGLGVLLTLGDKNNSFLTSQSPAALQQQLIEILGNTLQNSANSNAKNQYSQVLATLLPVIVKAADMGSNKASYNDILAAVTPLVIGAVSNGGAGGKYGDVMKIVQQIVQSASNGGLQGNDFQSITASLIPIALEAALDGYTGGQGSNVASIVVPVVLKLAQNGGKGASFQELMGSVLPLVLAQTTSGNNQYAKVIQIVTPLVLQAASGKGLDFNDLLAKLLPTALSSISSGSGNSQYGALVSTVLPVVIDALKDGSLQKDPSKLIATLTDVGLLSVVKAINPQLSKNAGFLRSDALLSVVMIGEKALAGQKIDTAELAKTFVDVLGKNKGGNTELLRFAAILATDPDKCAALSQVEDLYSEIAKYTGGQIGDLCKDPSKISSVVAEQIVRNLTGVTLNQSAVMESIVVLVNGLVVPHGEANGWSLSPDGVTISFHGSYIPQGMSKIQVSYVPSAQGSSIAR